MRFQRVSLLFTITLFLTPAPSMADAYSCKQQAELVYIAATLRDKGQSSEQTKDFLYSQGHDAKLVFSVTQTVFSLKAQPAARLRDLEEASCSKDRGEPYPVVPPSVQSQTSECNSLVADREALERRSTESQQAFSARTSALTKLGDWIESERSTVDKTNRKQVDHYNLMIDMYKLTLEDNEFREAEHARLSKALGIVVDKHLSRCH